MFYVEHFSGALAALGVGSWAMLAMTVKHVIVAAFRRAGACPTLAVEGYASRSQS